MSIAPAIIPEPALKVSAAALERVRELIREEGDPTLKLRVFIEGGGCSGFQYGFSFEADRAEDDFVLDRDHAGPTLSRHMNVTGG